MDLVSMLGASQAGNGTLFTIGGAGGNNMIAAAGQTIPLYPGSLSTLTSLATTANGNQPNRRFVVTYLDDTTDLFPRGGRDRLSTEKLGGESDPMDMA